MWFIVQKYNHKQFFVLDQWLEEFDKGNGHMPARILCIFHKKGEKLISR